MRRSFTTSTLDFGPSARGRKREEELKRDGEYVVYERTHLVNWVLFVYVCFGATTFTRP